MNHVKSPAENRRRFRPPSSARVERDSWHASPSAGRPPRPVSPAASASLSGRHRAGAHGADKGGTEPALFREHTASAHSVAGSRLPSPVLKFPLCAANHARSSAWTRGTARSKIADQTHLMRRCGRELILDANSRMTPSGRRAMTAKIAQTQLRTGKIRPQTPIPMRSAWITVREYGRSRPCNWRRMDPVGCAAGAGDNFRISKSSLPARSAC